MKSLKNCYFRLLQALNFDFGNYSKFRALRIVKLISRERFRDSRKIWRAYPRHSASGFVNIANVHLDWNVIFGGDDVVPIRSAIMVSLLSRNDWSIGDKGEIDSWVGPNYFVDNLKKQKKNCKQTAATSIAEKFINFRAQQKLTFVNLLVVSSTSQMFIWIEAWSLAAMIRLLAEL